jgi:hypothetical protein
LKSKVESRGSLTHKRQPYPSNSMELTLLTTIDTMKLIRCFSNNVGNVVDSKPALETCVVHELQATISS